MNTIDQELLSGLTVVCYLTRLGDVLKNDFNKPLMKPYDWFYDFQYRFNIQVMAGGDQAILENSDTNLYMNDLSDTQAFSMAYFEFTPWKYETEEGWQYVRFSHNGKWLCSDGNSGNLLTQQATCQPGFECAYWEAYQTFSDRFKCSFGGFQRPRGKSKKWQGQLIYGQGAQKVPFTIQQLPAALRIRSSLKTIYSHLVVILQETGRNRYIMCRKTPGNAASVQLGRVNGNSGTETGGLPSHPDPRWFFADQAPGRSQQVILRCFHNPEYVVVYDKQRRLTTAQYPRTATKPPHRLVMIPLCGDVKPTINTVTKVTSTEGN